MNYDVNVNEPVWSPKTRAAESDCALHIQKPVDTVLKIKQLRVNCAQHKHKCREYDKADKELEYLGFVFYNNFILSTS
jgi:hypothetical protein